jgi:hypothetical protein
MQPYFCDVLPKPIGVVDVSSYVIKYGDVNPILYI